jgi:Tfp pilus assembly protein FimT
MELLVGVGMLSVVTAAAVPVTGDILGMYQLRASTDQLAFEISRARMQAIAQNVFVRVRIDERGYVRERSTDGVSFVADDAVVSLPVGMKASVSGGGSPTFSRSGLAPTSTTITLAKGSASKTIWVNIVGRVNAS